MLSLSKHEHAAESPVTLRQAQGDRQRGLILVVAAVSQELRDFRLNGDRRVECLITGIGRRAGEAVRRRLVEGDIQLVVSAGFAGGARAGFRVGDLILASEVIEESTGRRLKSSVPPEPRRIPGARAGLFVTVERALSTSSAKSEFGARFGALAVEMETAGVAAAATEAGIPWMGLRVILDPMEEPLAVTSLGQGLRMLAVPTRWKKLSNFMQSVETAGCSLAEGLNRVISNVIPAQAGIRSSLARG